MSTTSSLADVSSDDSEAAGMPAPQVLDDDVVVLRIPPSARWIRLARLVATGVANAAGFGVDALEDARVAIDEACGILVEREPPSALTISLRPLDGSIEVDVSCDEPQDRSEPVGHAAEVLQAVTRSWNLHTSGRRLILHLVIADGPTTTGY